MEPAAHGAAVLDETARLAAVLDGADFAAPVPTCPGWTLADLTRHVGSVHRWFTVLLRRRVQERPTGRDVDLDLPASPQGLPGWLADGAAQAAEVFAATDLDAPMWAWGRDQHARFWVRRMHYETLVHRADAELARGLAPRIDLASAVDGVDEFLTNLPFAAPFAPGTSALRGDGQVIRFGCTDHDAQWAVQLRPDDFGPLPGDGHALGGASTTVSAPAAELLLFLYGRLPASHGALRIQGDRDLFSLWTAHSAF
ncbi:maleylpyruvate isomerase family mycothiol-dependent enzyme [Streptomyces sp. WAC06614]|uniref:maleylpyruvate isomerase family mycothiol-dependent enzyme n=1 Tax=Streptomyces sp. WAC06614 TaxID=2487416 RepID=UPI000F7753AE|nr:maleylpyruvate isomerase family mycothiol-dependent enzyme [Streptomyces sp. WAC06614]RSS81844.1 maleylpyruvate isomerase family mycothiol-dependent enzyme [Streptomyces sp. WAC06614]